MLSILANGNLCVCVCFGVGWWWWVELFYTGKPECNCASTFVLLSNFDSRSITLHRGDDFFLSSCVLIARKDGFH